MIEATFAPEIRDQFTFVWSQEQCTIVETGTAEFEDAAERPSKKHKNIFLKRLSSVWQAFPQFDATNTLLIDDSLEKTVDNPPNLHYCPTSWSIAQDGALDDDFLQVTGKGVLEKLTQHMGTVGEFIQTLSVEK